MNIRLITLLLCSNVFINTVIKGQNTSDLSYAQIDSLMMIQYKKGDFEGAIPLMKLGMEKAKAEFGEIDSIYGEYYNNLGFFYQHSGQVKKSVEVYLKVIELRKKIYPQPHSDLVGSMSNLATSYQQMGKYEQAIPLFQEALALLKIIAGPESPQYAQILNNLANIYYQQQDYVKTEPLFLEVLAIYKKNYGEAHPVYAHGMNNLAGLYMVTDRIKESENLYKKALAIKAKNLGKQHPNYAVSLNNLGFLYQHTGQHQKAEQIFLEANQIWLASVGEQHPSYITSLTNLAKNALASQQLDKAFTYALSSLAANSVDFKTVFPNLFLNKEGATSVFDPLLCCAKIESSKYLELSKLDYRHYLELDQSLKTLLEVVKSKHQVLERNHSAEASAELARLHALSKAAMGINDKLRNEFTERATNLRVLKDNHLFVRYGIDAALKINTPKAIEESFSFAELNKSVLLMDAVKGSRARSMGDLPDSLALQEIDLQHQKDQLKKLKYQSKTQDEQDKIIAQENKLNQKITAFLHSLKDKYPHYHQLKYENVTVKAGDIQALLDDKTMLLEYFVEEEVIYLYAITKAKVDLFPIEINKELLHSKIKDLRKALSDYVFLMKEPNKAYEMYTTTAAWFYEKLLKVALKNRSIEHLVIIADGELGHLPFEVFLTDKMNQEEVRYSDLPYLLNKYQISYNYSATLWKENISNAAHNNNHKMLACAADYTPQKQNQVSLELLGSRTEETAELRQLLQPLPAAQSEVGALAKTFDGTFLQGQESNEAFFKNNATQFGIIHLAMHGILNPKESMLSSLAFTENGDSLEDNFLQAFEIAHLNLNADLVVLSACETGYGKFEQGEGVISLARSFMYAGVPSLVVSLWQVNDQSTEMIMKSFYDKLLKGMTKDKALQEAKMTYVKSATGITAHPVFWSPFIQLGDSRAISLSQKGAVNWLWPITGGLLLLMIIIGRVVRQKKKEA